MFIALFTTVLGMLTTADTTVTFGVVERDLTGDGIPEVLTLSGTGETMDSLEVKFTVDVSGRTVYSRTWPLTRASFDPRRRISDTELQARLDDYGGWFFAESKFISSTQFVDWLEDSFRLHIPRIPLVIGRGMTPNDSVRGRRAWEGMQAAGVTLFQFSPGGNAIEVIGWSPTEERFFDLLECC
jgi:hypothetical protein